MDEQLKISIKKDVDQRTANAAGLYNGIPVFFCCGAIIKDRLPDRLIICQVITTEKIILEQFRGGQADSKRVQRIEYLLFIIIRIQVDPNKVSFPTIVV